MNRRFILRIRSFLFNPKLLVLFQGCNVLFTNSIAFNEREVGLQAGLWVLKSAEVSNGNLPGFLS